MFARRALALHSRVTTTAATVVAASPSRALAQKASGSKASSVTGKSGSTNKPPASTQARQKPSPAAVKAAIASNNATVEADEYIDVDAKLSPADEQTAKLLEDIVRSEPAFLHWFVQIYVPKVADSVGDVDEDPNFDGDKFVHDAYQQWSAAGKPIVPGPKLSL
jgi:hypothetical protein